MGAQVLMVSIDVRWGVGGSRPAAGIFPFTWDGSRVEVVDRIRKLRSILDAMKGTFRPRRSIAVESRLACWVGISALVALATGCVLPAVSPNLCGPVSAQYSLIPLPFLATSINDSRQIAGTTEKHQAATWSERTGLYEIPMPAGFANSEGVAINNAGHVLVMAYDRTLSLHQAYIFSHGRLTQLPGQQTRGFRINDRDDIAGEAAEPGTGKTVPVYWSHGRLHQIDTCCGGSAKDISRQRTVIGDRYDANGHYSAFIWTTNDGVQSLGPANRFSSAIAINARGHALIEASPDIYFYDSQNLYQLNLAKKFKSHPYAISECDAIVGAYGPFSDKYRAFIWEAGTGFADLNARLTPDSGWILKSANGLNIHGDVVGQGTLDRDEDSGFLMLPIREK